MTTETKTSETNADAEKAAELLINALELAKKIQALIDAEAGS